MPQNLVRNSLLGTTKQCDLSTYSREKKEIWAPGGVIGPLIRDYYVIRYVVSGRGKLIFNHAEFDISAGQSFIICPGMVVTEVADESDPWIQTWIVVQGVRTASLLKSLGISSKKPIFPWDDNPEFLSFLYKIIDECPKSSDESSELLRSAHAFLLFDFLTNYIKKHQLSEASAHQVDNYIKKAIYYMESNYTTNIKISDVSKYVGLNRSYFFTIFKERVNLSPQEYLTRLRIKKACELFAYPDSTVANVANSLKYDTSAFYRHFKRIMGISPSEYKKRLSIEAAKE